MAILTAISVAYIVEGFIFVLYPWLLFMYALYIFLYNF